MSPARKTRIFSSSAPPLVLLLRLAVGLIFVSEGAQKFMFAEALGVGRFTKIGIPAPELMAPFVGLVEMVGGAMLVVGLATRVVAAPLLFNMLVAITSTKLVTLGRNGFWKTAHEGRTDVLMIVCLVYLLVVGAGPWSADRRISGGESGRRMPPA
jgi:putative oxidoreductase